MEISEPRDPREKPDPQELQVSKELRECKVSKEKQAPVDLSDTRVSWS